MRGLFERRIVRTTFHLEQLAIGYRLSGTLSLDGISLGTEERAFISIAALWELGTEPVLSTQRHTSRRWYFVSIVASVLI